MTVIKLQAHIDEINMDRVREDVEREWRRKEKEAALKRLEAEKMLQKERMEQINNKRIMQALEIERDKRESERIVRMQEAALCKEKAELERKQQQALILRAEILKQVCIINAYVCIVTSKLNARMRTDARLASHR